MFVFDWLLNLLLEQLPGLYLPLAEGESDGDDSDGDDKGGDGSSGSDGRADTLAAENQKLKDEIRKAKAEARKRDADSRVKKAAEDNKLKDELTRTSEELEKARERAEALEEKARARVDRMLAKLPKEIQEEIELVKDDIPLDKLEALVEKRSSSSMKKPDDGKSDNKPDGGDSGGGKPPPSVGVGGTKPKTNDGHQLHVETKDVLHDLYAKPRHYDVAEHLGVSAEGKFGWGRSDDEHQNTANFIHLLDRIKAQPTGGVDENILAERVLKPRK